MKCICLLGFAMLNSVEVPIFQFTLDNDLGGRFVTIIELV
jgi:hypothetical protein